jgi:predicted TIM-barrel fold metal-dependent hydrolase
VASPPRLANCTSAIVLLALGLGCQSGATSANGSDGDIAPGDFSRFADLDWIDAHVHLHSHLRIADFVAYQDRFGMSRMVLLSPPRAAALLSGERPNVNAEALLAKALHPDRFYAFGGPDLTPLASGGEAALGADLEAQVTELADAGADGIKLYFPAAVVSALRQPPLAFDYLPDNPALAGLFETAAARALPILIHIDPQYTANLHAALALYPDATWIVTHLGFAGADTTRLEAILAAGPNVYLDVGHYVHLGELLQARSAARDLLIKHRNRVFQSSDFASGCEAWGLTDDTCPSESMAVSQAWTLRAMLETTQDVTFKSVYTGNDTTVTGLGLPEATLQALYHDTATGLLGTPKRLQCAPALIHIDRLLAHTTRADEVARLQTIRTLFRSACR